MSKPGPACGPCPRSDATSTSRSLHRPNGKTKRQARVGVNLNLCTTGTYLCHDLCLFSVPVILYDIRCAAHGDSLGQMSRHGSKGSIPRRTTRSRDSPGMKNCLSAVPGLLRAGLSPASTQINPYSRPSRSTISGVSRSNTTSWPWSHPEFGRQATPCLPEKASSRVSSYTAGPHRPEKRTRQARSSLGITLLAEMPDREMVQRANGSIPNEISVGISHPQAPQPRRCIGIRDQ